MSIILTVVAQGPGESGTVNRWYYLVNDAKIEDVVAAQEVMRRCLPTIVPFTMTSSDLQTELFHPLQTF